MAFRHISSSRTSNGYGPNPISLSEISAYIHLMGEPWCDRPTFVSLISRMDRRFMEVITAKNKGAKGGGRKT